MKTLYKIFLVVFFFIIFNRLVFSQESAMSTDKQEVYEGKIVKIVEEKNIEVMGQKQLYQKLEVQITRGSLEGKTIVIENGDLPIINLQKYKVGELVKISKAQTDTNGDFFYITDYVRSNTLVQLFILFAILAILIGRVRGITSLVGMVFSFLIIFKFILPQILSGADPVVTALIGSTVIIPVTFILSHGINKKTISAVIGTVISLFITGVLTVYFVNAARISGFSSEEAGFLQVYMQGNLDIKGLLLAGIIIGALGVFDDITVSQASIVEQLKKNSPKIKTLKLYKSTMSIGQDHIASMVNTLVLVYTGAALPLLLLFVHGNNSISDVLDFEIIAEEVIRTLVGSIGLILAVPLTTIIAVIAFRKRAD